MLAAHTLRVHLSGCLSGLPEVNWWNGMATLLFPVLGVSA